MLLTKKTEARISLEMATGRYCYIVRLYVIDQRILNSFLFTDAAIIFSSTIDNGVMHVHLLQCASTSHHLDGITTEPVVPDFLFTTFPRTRV